jgi:ribonuclease P protein component
MKSENPALNVFTKDVPAVSSAVKNSESRARQTSPQASLRNGNEFPRTAKLLKHALFDQVYKGGQRHFSGLMTVFFLRRTQEEGSSSGKNQILGPRVGFTVGRVLGNSVVRNRIRRRMREAVRFNLNRLPSDVDVVINPKKLVLEAEFPKIVAEVERAFAVVEKKLCGDRACGDRLCGDGAVPRPGRVKDPSPQ